MQSVNARRRENKRIRLIVIAPFFGGDWRPGVLFCCSISNNALEGRKGTGSQHIFLFFSEIWQYAQNQKICFGNVARLQIGQNNSRRPEGRREVCLLAPIGGIRDTNCLCLRPEKCTAAFAFFQKSIRQLHAVIQPIKRNIRILAIHAEISIVFR